jgi:hypothetical protein
MVFGKACGAEPATGQLPHVKRDKLSEDELARLACSGSEGCAVEIDHTVIEGFAATRTQITFDAAGAAFTGMDVILLEIIVQGREMSLGFSGDARWRSTIDAILDTIEIDEERLELLAGSS